MARARSKTLRWAAPFVAGLLAAAAATAWAAEFSSPSAPHWTSLLPPLVAIGLALLLKEVIGALLLGIFVGSLLISPEAPFAALIRIPTDIFPGALADEGNAAIVLFSLMLGAMVGVLAQSGGMAGIVRAMTRLASSRRGGLLTTWVLGLIIFFDDYANTLLVGHTVRPYTDEMKISRAKLAYIVDSTAAPVASIAVISTWVGFQIGLIGDAIANLPLQTDAYILFLRSIPHSAYSIFALVFVASIAWWGRDVGPMHSVETRAAAGEDPTTEGSSTDEMEQAEAGRHPLILALVPIGIVILATFAGLYISGRVAVGGGAPLFEVLGSADSSAVLLASSFLGMVAAALLAATLGGKPATEVSDSLIGGIKAMMPAMVILLLAWSLGDICGRLGTAEYVIEAVSGRLPAVLVPTTLFVVSALIAFSTGTSWGAMAILIPIAIPLAYQIPLAEGSPEAVAAGVLLGTVGAVLAGATFGDHCSPISDTTILSSMASGCHHIDHVRTQIPYALIAGGVAIVFGYLPSGFGLPPWPGLLLGGVLLALLPRFFKPVETAGPRRKP